MSRSSFIFALALPFIAKVVYGAGLALSFLDPSSYAQSLGVGVAFILFIATVLIAVVYLFRRASAKAGAVCLSIIVAFVLPTIDFDPEYFLFRNNRDRYRAEIDRDISPSPKFMIFPLRELASFPAGGNFYDIVYDESGQFGRPEADRTSDWNAKHGHLSLAGIRGGSNPHAELQVRSFGDNFFVMITKY